MAKRTFTATDAAGATHKRTSASRPYSHTVVFLPCYEHDMRRATDPRHDKHVGDTFDYYAQCAAGTHEHVTHVTPTSAFHPSYTAEQVSEMQTKRRELNAYRLATAKAETDGKTRDQYIAEKRASRVSGVEERQARGYYETWQNAGWCGRLDLAQKLAGGIKQAAGIAILEAVEAVPAASKSAA